MSSYILLPILFNLFEDSHEERNDSVVYDLR